MKKIFLLLLLLTPLFSRAQIINLIAGTHLPGYYGDGGPATAAGLYEPNQLTVDGLGNVYIADAGNNRVRKVSSAGIITTVAGNGAATDTGDGGPATAAALVAPLAVALDTAGNLYIADAGNYIRKINTAGIISTIAGNGTANYTSDGGPADTTSLNFPSSLTFDAHGNLYFTDANNNRVRKIDTAGIITTIAGTGTAAFAGDGGTATAASLQYPNDVKIDKAGNIYIADMYNDRIRVINTAGIISTVAGTGAFGFFGDGGAATSAELNYPYAICLDTAANLYITDNANERIREVKAATGIIESVVGNGTPGYIGDGGPADSAEIHNTGGIYVDTFGNLYIADFGNNVVREVNNIGFVTGIPAITVNGLSGVYLYPNPATSALTIICNDKITTIDIINASGQIMHAYTCNATQVDISVSDLPAGVYFARINGLTEQAFVKK